VVGDRRPPRWVPCSSGMTFTSTDCWLASSRRSSSQGSMRTTGFISRWLHLRPALPYGPSVRWVFGRLGDLVGRQLHLSHHHEHHGRPPPSLSGFCRTMPRLELPRRSRWSRSGYCKDWRLGGEYGGAATYVAELHRRGSAASIPAGFRQPPRSAYSPRCWWSRHSHMARRGRLQGLGMAHSVHRIGRAIGRVVMDPKAACRESGLREDEELGNDLEGNAQGSVRRVEQSENRFW